MNIATLTDVLRSAMLLKMHGLSLSWLVVMNPT